MNPTGVTLITSAEETGEPVGMIVGTFSAVSEDPPMAGFMPNASSQTFKTIAANGHFVGSVLGSAHEELCRNFLARPERRFNTGQWNVTTAGLPLLSDSLAWFEAKIRDIHPAGDHYVVLADVLAYGVGDGRGGLPLLFLKGGYGAFAVPNSGDNLLDFRDRIRRAEKMSGVVELLARTHGVRCVIATVAGDSVINLVSSPDRPDRERMSFPFAADEIIGAAREAATQLGVLDSTDPQTGSEAARLRSGGRTGAEKAATR